MSPNDQNKLEQEENLENLSNVNDIKKDDKTKENNYEDKTLNALLSCFTRVVSSDKADNPKSILGYSKRASENLTRFLSAKNPKKIANIVRFGNVIGSSGSAIPNFLDQINNNSPITITHKKASRYFMSINQACYLVLKTFDLKIRNKIFFLEMGKPISIYNLALKLINLKKKILPDYRPSLKISGLKKGEKLREILYSGNKKYKTTNKMIYY